MFLAGLIASVLAFAIIRRASEVRFAERNQRKEKKMIDKAKKMHKVIGQAPRRFWQYVAETIWASAAGALVAPMGS